MSNIIHMETETVRSVALQLTQAIEDMRSQVQTLHNQVQVLDWQGASRDEFVNEFGLFSQNMNVLTDDGVILAERVQREVDEWEGVDGNVTNSGGIFIYVNRTTPTDVSTTGVVDERPPWKQFLGDNTPLAFIPGFTPPAGGDIITIDDRIHQKFGRDINLVDGEKQWLEHEAAAVDRAVANFPLTLAGLSQLRNIYRDSKFPGHSSYAGVWFPQGYNKEPSHEEASISIYDTSLGVPRQGGYSDMTETVLYHELVHSAQFNEDGNFNDLTVSYLEEFGWEFDGEQWKYSGTPNSFPGTSDTVLSISTGYPQEGQNGLEDMAEAVTYYRYEPETLLRDSPARYEWVKNNIFSGEEFK